MTVQGLLTVKELSSFLGVSPCTVYRMVEGGGFLSFVVRASASDFRRKPSTHGLIRILRSQCQYWMAPAILALVQIHR